MNPKIWTWTAIVRALHDEGMTLSALAELNGIHPTVVRACGTRVSRKAEAAISKFLEVPVEELFPNRYPIRKSRILSSKYERLLASRISKPASAA